MRGTDTLAHKVLEAVPAKRNRNCWNPDHNTKAPYAALESCFLGPYLNRRPPPGVNRDDTLRRIGIAHALDTLKTAVEENCPLITVDAAELANGNGLLWTGRDLLAAGVLPVPASRFCIEADFTLEPSLVPDMESVDRVIVCAEATDSNALILSGAIRGLPRRSRERVWFLTPGCAYLFANSNVRHGSGEVPFNTDIYWPDLNIDSPFQDILVRVVLTTLALMLSPDAEKTYSPPAEKHNRKRAANGRVRIPGRTIVRVNPDRLRNVSESARGSRASPKPHFRRGHIRKLPNGKRIIIRPMLVGVAPDERERMKSKISASVYELRGTQHIPL